MYGKLWPNPVDYDSMGTKLKIATGTYPTSVKHPAYSPRA